MQLSKRFQRRLKKELVTLILSVDPFTNTNRNQTRGGNSSLESEWSNLDSDIETLASSSESNFDRYLGINKGNLAILDISHSCFVFQLKLKYSCKFGLSLCVVVFVNISNASKLVHPFKVYYITAKFDVKPPVRNFISAGIMKFPTSPIDGSVSLPKGSTDISIN